MPVIIPIFPVSGGSGPSSSSSPIIGFTKASDIFSIVRALIDDIEGDYADDPRLIPHLNVALQQISICLMANPNTPRFKRIVVINQVAALTQSLSAYFAPGAALAGLSEILTMREKATGQLDTNYVPMYPQGDVPVVTQGDFNRHYIFTGTDLLMPGALQDLDIRIFGHFLLPPAVDGDSVVPDACVVYLQYMTAAGMSRAHGNRELAADYMAQATAALTGILNNLLMEQQTMPSTREVNYG